MFTTQQRFRREKTILQIGILKNEKPLTYKEVIHLWKEDADFRLFFIEIINIAPFAAIYLETPPITKSNVHRFFEMVLIKSRTLVLQPQSIVFQEHFDQAERDVVTFSNLGRNAVLVVPTPQKDADYSHLMAFLQNAPLSQIHNFWKTLANAIEERLNDKPVWVSTAGNGVHWLHVRLDSRPKYYKYPVYKRGES